MEFSASWFELNLRRDRVCLVLVRQVAGVGKAGENVVARQPRIVREEILFRLPRGEQFQNELNGKASATDHRFAGQDLRIDDDTLCQRHAQILPQRASGLRARDARCG